MLTDKQKLLARLRLLEGDLKDSTDPKVLARYPHLGAEGLRAQVQSEIDEVKHRIGLIENPERE